MKVGIQEQYNWLQNEIKAGHCNIESLPVFLLGAIRAISEQHNLVEIHHLLQAYRMLLEEDIEQNRV